MRQRCPAPPQAPVSLQPGRVPHSRRCSAVPLRFPRRLTPAGRAALAGEVSPREAAGARSARTGCHAALRRPPRSSSRFPFHHLLAASMPRPKGWAALAVVAGLNPSRRRPSGSPSPCPASPGLPQHSTVGPSIFFKNSSYLRSSCATAKVSPSPMPQPEPPRCPAAWALQAVGCGGARCVPLSRRQKFCFHSSLPSWDGKDLASTPRSPGVGVPGGTETPGCSWVAASTPHPLFPAWQHAGLLQGAGRAPGGFRTPGSVPIEGTWQLSEQAFLPSTLSASSTRAPMWRGVKAWGSGGCRCEHRTVHRSVCVTHTRVCACL